MGASTDASVGAVARWRHRPNGCARDRVFVGQLERAESLGHLPSHSCHALRRGWVRRRGDLDTRFLNLLRARMLSADFGARAR
eukprot:5047462-Pyramimonas_sp.AAC.1